MSNLNSQLFMHQLLTEQLSLESDPSAQEENMQCLYETVIDYVPAPKDNRDEPLQFQVALLDYNDYVGRIGIGRVFRGSFSLFHQVS